MEKNRRMDRSEALKSFIRRHIHLFWYTPKDKIEEVSDQLILEQLLNYAEMKVINEYIDIVGFSKACEIFFSLKGRQKQNIYPEIYHLFDAYFKQNAQRNT